METVFGSTAYFGAGKMNKGALKLIQDHHADVSRVDYLNTWLPHKPVVYALTNVGYLEGNFQIPLAGALRNYNVFQYYPYEAIKSLVLQDGGVYFQVDLDHPSTFLRLEQPASGLQYAGSSVFAADFENVVSLIQNAQKELGISPAVIGDSIPQDKPVEQNEPKTDIGSQTDDLLKAKQLLDAGVLSQDEFDAMKKQILGI